MGRDSKRSSRKPFILTTHKMSDTHYVWTVNSGSRITVTCTFAGTKSECRRHIIGRWGHWPPFAFLSTIQDENKARKRFTGLSHHENA